MTKTEMKSMLHVIIAIQQLCKLEDVTCLTSENIDEISKIEEECAKENRKYVSLDSSEKRNLAQNDPALFLQKYTPPVLIDEIQYAP